MQLDPDTVERMAREYNRSLADYNRISDSAANLIEKIILLIENQLDIIDCLLCCPQSRHCRKILNYLKNLKKASIIALNRLLNRGEYIPLYRNPDRIRDCQNAFHRLVDIQIDIFILLDRLSLIKENLTNILILETRAMALIAVICR